MNFLKLILTLSYTSVAASGLFSASYALAGSPAVLEVSTRGIPLDGSITFLDTDGQPVGNPISVHSERYIWKCIPAGATRFTITSLATTSDPQNIFPTGHTLVSINPTQPLDPSSIGTEAIERLPLISSLRNFQSVAAGTTGWIFVGSLTSDSDDSDWASLYILRASDQKKPDHFTFARLNSLIATPEPELESFLADFPLNLRESPGPTKNPAPMVLRPGQKIIFIAVERQGLSVFAKINVTE